MAGNADSGLPGRPGLRCGNPASPDSPRPSPRARATARASARSVTTCSRSASSGRPGLDPRRTRRPGCYRRSAPPPDATAGVASHTSLPRAPERRIVAGRQLVSRNGGSINPGAAPCRGFPPQPHRPCPSCCKEAGPSSRSGMCRETGEVCEGDEGPRAGRASRSAARR
jgi:hypothetical protein